MPNPVSRASLFATFMLTAAPATHGLPLEIHPERYYVPTPLSRTIGVLDLDEDGRDEFITYGYQSSVSVVSVHGYEGGPSRYAQRDALIIEGFRALYSVGRNRWTGGPVLAIGANDSIRTYEGVPLQLDGTFTNSCTARFITGVGDVDGDADLDAYGLHNGNLFVCDLSTGIASIEGAGGPCGIACASIMAGQFDGDAALELVLGKDPTAVVDGATFQSEWQVPGTLTPMLAGQLDADAGEEFVGRIDGRIVSVATAPYTPVADFVWNAPGLGMGDLGNDGVAEVVESYYGLRAYSGISMTPVVNMEIPLFATQTAIGRLDPDPNGEIVVAVPAFGDKPSLAVLDGLGLFEEWSEFGHTGSLSPLAVGDVDANGTDEVVVGAILDYDRIIDNWLRILDCTTLQLEWERSEFAPGNTISSHEAVVLRQLDSDPALEIVVTTYRDIHILDGATRVLQWRLSDRAPANAPYLDLVERMQFADVDADGQAELVVANGNSIHGVDPITGNQRWTFGGPGTSGLVGLEIHQLDQDPALEIVYSTGGSTRLLDGATGAVQWRRDVTGGPSTVFHNRSGPAELLLVEQGCIKRLDPVTGDTVAPDIHCFLSPSGAIRVLDWPDPVILVTGNEIMLLDTRSNVLARSGNLGGTAAARGAIDVIRRGGRYEVIAGSDAGVFRFNLSDPLTLFSDQFEASHAK